MASLNELQGDLLTFVSDTLRFSGRLVHLMDELWSLRNDADYFMFSEEYIEVSDDGLFITLKEEKNESQRIDGAHHEEQQIDD